MMALSLKWWLITLTVALIGGNVSGQYHVNEHEDHHAHHHKRPGKIQKGSSFHEGVVFDKEHIYEDIKETYNVDMGKDAMNDEEIAFYYFQTHDFDKNGKLDGLEILNAMNHIFDEPDSLGSATSTTPKPDPENDGPVEEYYRLRAQRKWNDKYMQDADFIDGLFEQFDGDKDGYLSYVEYTMASKSQ